MSGKEQSPESGRQRLDKWLFFARMVKTRSLAQTYINSGNVSVNGATVRQSSHMLKLGDMLHLTFERMDRVLCVKASGVRRGPFDEARLLYDDLTPPREPKDRLSRLDQAVREPGSGRPTKKDRRAIDRLLPDPVNDGQ